jgi:TnpA family transposase
MASAGAPTAAAPLSAKAEEDIRNAQRDVFLEMTRSAAITVSHRSEAVFLEKLRQRKRVSGLMRAWARVCVAVATQ